MSRPPKVPSNQTTPDQVEPKAAMAAFAVELYRTNQAAKFREELEQHAQDGYVSAQDYAEALEECGIDARTLLLRRILLYLDPTAEKTDSEGVHRIPLSKLLEAATQPPARRKSDPNINYADLYAEASKKFVTGEAKSKTKVDSLSPDGKLHLMESLYDPALQADHTYSPGDNMDPVAAMCKIGTKLVMSGKMEDMQEALELGDPKKTGKCSLADFAEALEECEVQARMLVLRRMFLHFDGEQEEGTVTMKIDQLMSLLAAHAIAPVAVQNADKDDDEQDTEDDDDDDDDTPKPKEPLRKPLAQASAKPAGSKSAMAHGRGEMTFKTGGGRKPTSDDDDSDEDETVALDVNNKDPSEALRAIAQALKKSNLLSEFEEELAALDTNKSGIISVQDFAEALEGCNVVVHTQGLRQILDFLGGTTDSDLLVVNRKLLTAAIRAKC